MGPSDRDIGQNIQQARYEVGQTQAELALSVDLDRTAISKVENGERSLTAAELANVAGALGVDPGHLLRLRPDASHAVAAARLLMRADRVDLDDGPQLAWFIQLLEGLSLEVRRPNLGNARRSLPPGQSGELAARRFRRKMLLEADAPVHSMSGLLSTLRVPVVVARFPSRSRISGCLLRWDGSSAAVLVNSSHPLPRQRFTVAHELAHLFLDTSVAAAACGAGEARRGARSAHERRADVFASALLLPRRAVDRAVVGGVLTFDALREFCDHYGVSEAAAINRLQALHLVSPSDARALRKLGGNRSSEERLPPFRVIGELLQREIQKQGSRLSDDSRGYEVAPDSEVVK